MESYTVSYVLSDIKPTREIREDQDRIYGGLWIHTDGLKALWFHETGDLLRGKRSVVEGGGR